MRLDTTGADECCLESMTSSESSLVALGSTRSSRYHPRETLGRLGEVHTSYLVVIISWTFSRKISSLE